MKEYLNKKVEFYTGWTVRGFYGKRIGVVTEVKGENFAIDGVWFHKKDIYDLRIVSNSG